MTLAQAPFCWATNFWLYTRCIPVIYRYISLYHITHFCWLNHVKSSRGKVDFLHTCRKTTCLIRKWLSNRAPELIILPILTMTKHLAVPKMIDPAGSCWYDNPHMAIENFAAHQTGHIHLHRECEPSSKELGDADGHHENNLNLQRRNAAKHSKAVQPRSIFPAA